MRGLSPARMIPVALVCGAVSLGLGSDSDVLIQIAGALMAAVLGALLSGIAGSHKDAAHFETRSQSGRFRRRWDGERLRLTVTGIGCAFVVITIVLAMVRGDSVSLGDLNLGFLFLLGTAACFAIVANERPR